MVKISLVNPCLDYPAIKTKNYSTYNKVFPPLSLSYSAAILEKEGFDVKIVDANAERFTIEGILQKIKDSEKVFITTSTLDRWQCPHLDLEPFLKLINEIKKYNPVYLMGVHGTLKPKEMLNLTKVNGIIIGEPELTILDICKGKKFEDIDGLVFEKKGKMVFTKERSLLDLDDLPLPAFHLIPMRKYFYEFLGDEFVVLEGSRGCPFKCTFCLKKMYDKYRKKSVENLIKEVKYCIEKYDVKNAYFIDLEFTINKKLVEKLCDFLIEKKYDFKWCCQTRFDSIDKKLLQKMKKAGCKLIHYGVETGSPRIMESINKDITLEQIENGMRITKEVGIDSACFFMFGFPTETEEEMKMTIDFAKRINPNYASFHVATPYPGTEFYEKIKEKTENEIFPLYYSDHSPEFLHKMIKKAFKDFYLRPYYILPILFKNPKFLWKQFRLFMSYFK